MAVPVDLITQWIELKGEIVAWSGLDRSALQIYGAISCLLLLAVLTRRPLASPLPWLALLFLVAMNEIATILSDRLVEDRELSVSLHDMGVGMLVPTLLCLISRFAPSVIAPRAHRRVEWRPPVASRPAFRHIEPIDDAEFEDMEQDEAGDWRPVRRIGG